VSSQAAPFDEMRAVRRAATLHTPALLERTGVVGVGAGKRIRAGTFHSQNCVTVFVSKKQPAGALSVSETLPSTVVSPGGRDVGVDVVEFETPTAPPPQESGRRMRIAVAGTGPGAPVSAFIAGLRRLERPATGGLSMANALFPAGTLTFGVRDRFLPAIRYVLSCNHVLGRMGAAVPGEPIWQPSTLDGGTAVDLIARFSRSAPLLFNGITPEVVDAAIGVSTNLVTQTVQGLGFIRSFRPENTVLPGEWVNKVGRTTGLTYGRILAVNATIQVDYSALGFPGKRVFYHRQIVTTGMGAYGDSGSLLTDTAGVGVGLLFSGNASGGTVFNPLEAVLSVLGIVL
jgi:hypothetical protein